MSPMTSQRSRHHRRRSRGQSLVEFALIIPILLIILGGILDFGFMLYSRMTLINATREGARWAVTQSNPQAIPTDLNSSTGHIGANMPGLSWASLTRAISCIPDPGVTSNTPCDFVAGGSRDAVAGDSIRISTTYTYNSFFASLFGATVNFGTQVQMVLEVPTN